MRSRSIVRARRTPQPPRSRRWPLGNTMSFPQTLRDAIPTLSRCWGRCLLLNSITGRSQNNELFGKRVQIKFQVEESGKLTGKFDVWMDLDLEAARELARTLNQLADDADDKPR